jgi:competence protein ComEA
MERSPVDWRAIDEPTPNPMPPAAGAPPTNNTRNLIAIVALAALGVLGAGGFLVASTPRAEVMVDASSDGGAGRSGAPASGSAAVTAPLVVDVSGGVARPGLYRLAAGSRVGDAIDAAGGFGPSVDAAAATAALNLAEPLTDGAKVLVPERGQQAPAVSDGPVAVGGGATGGGGKVDLNHATSAQLEELPGIGPVTAAKIIAAREEAAFRTVEELLSRKVLGPSTYEKVKALVTVGG